MHSLFVSPHITLEPQIVAHAPMLFRALSDSRIYEYIDDECPTSLSAFERRIELLESRESPDGTEGWLNWAIVHHGASIGYLQATVYPNKTAEIAYVLNPDFWGRGIGSACVEHLLDELASTYHCVDVYAVTHCDNARSRRLLERVGFKVALFVGEEEVEYRRDLT